MRNEGLDEWQRRWNESDQGRKVFSYFPKVSKARLKGDFYINQLITGHGALGPYQQRFFGVNAGCFCGVGIADEEHVVKHCCLFNEIRARFFPSDYLIKNLKELLDDENSTGGIRDIMEEMVSRYCNLD